MKATSSETSTRAQAKEATQEAIIKAASARFFSLGYSGSSLADIAKDANIKVPLLVYHFQNKDNLWKRCVDALYGKMDCYLNELFEQVKGLSGKDYLRAVLTGYIKATAQAPEYMRLMFLEGMQKNERLEWLVNTHQRHHSHMIMNVIEQAQAQGSFKKVDIVHAKYILAAAVGAPFILSPEFELMTGENPGQDEVVNRHVDACLEVLFDLK